MISLNRWLGQGFQLINPLTFGFSAHTTANAPLKVNTGLLNLTELKDEVNKTHCQCFPTAVQSTSK